MSAAREFEEELERARQRMQAYERYAQHAYAEIIAEAYRVYLADIEKARDKFMRSRGVPWARKRQLGKDEE